MAKVRPKARTKTSKARTKTSLDLVSRWVGGAIAMNFETLRLGGSAAIADVAELARGSAIKLVFVN